MFFRREKPRKLSFDDYLTKLREFGFEVQGQGNGRALAKRRGCAALVEDGGEADPRVGGAGVLVGGDVAEVVNGGFQQFLRTSDGRRVPATATHLRALHDFTEDMKEALGLPSYYNESLGTTSNAHLYDRVQDRDQGEPERPWNHPPSR